MVAAVGWAHRLCRARTGIYGAEIVDCGGRWVTPGLIDCHTHLVYGGNRAAEFEARLNGATYEEIARAGGGIASTVRATREASEEALYAASLPRLNRCWPRVLRRWRLNPVTGYPRKRS